MSLPSHAPAHVLAVEIATALDPHDLEDLCEATNAAIIEGARAARSDSPAMYGMV